MCVCVILLNQEKYHYSIKATNSVVYHTQSHTNEFTCRRLKIL